MTGVDQPGSGTMRERQRGITAIGFIIMAAIVGVIGFAGLKLTPIYLNQMKVASVLNDVKLNLDNQDTSVRLIRAAIDKRLNIEMIDEPALQDFEISKVEGGYKVRVNFESRVNYLGNLYLVVVFNDSVEIRR
jgi:hypothetical protein